MTFKEVQDRIEDRHKVWDEVLNVHMNRLIQVHREYHSYKESPMDQLCLALSNVILGILVICNEHKIDFESVITNRLERMLDEAASP